MSKKTKTFPLKEFWERKLNIKYDIELEYCKKFCGVSYKYKMLLKNINRYNDSEKITYENWKCHILKTIEKLNLEELLEYSRFLNQEYRNKETQLISFRTLLIPYAICIISGGLISPIFNVLMEISSGFDKFELTVDYVISMVIILIIFMLPLFIPIRIFKRLNKSNSNESIIQYFFQDTKEIVDEKIEFIKTIEQESSGNNKRAED